MLTQMKIEGSQNNNTTNDFDFSSAMSLFFSPSDRLKFRGIKLIISAAIKPLYNTMKFIAPSPNTYGVLLCVWYILNFRKTVLKKIRYDPHGD